MTRRWGERCECGELVFNDKMIVNTVYVTSVHGHLQRSLLLCFSDIAMTYLGYTGLALALSILALWLEGCDFDDDDEAGLLGVGAIFASTFSWDFPQTRIFFVQQFCRLWRIMIHPCVCTGIFTWRYIIYALHIDTCIHIVLVCVYTVCICVHVQKNTYIYIYTCMYHHVATDFNL